MAIPCAAFAAPDKASTVVPLDNIDKATDSHELYLSIRRASLDWSITDVRNADAYQDSPISALNADSQDFFKGIFDGALEYSFGKFKWENSLFMEYGKTTLKPYNEPKTVNENADDILVSSDLLWNCWEFGGLKFGPTVRGAYDTEFVAGDNAPRQNLVRAGAGLSLFDHPIIKTLYVAGMYEYDFTYSYDKVSKSGVEAGWRLEYDLRPGVKFSTNGYYREYLSFSNYQATDLERDLNAVVRMDTNLWGNFTMGPYVQYRLAKARGADVYGGNFMLGISVGYINKFGLITPADKISE